MDADKRDQLIARFLADQASKDECIQLDAWRKDDRANEVIFEASQQVWQQTEAAEPSRPFDLDRGWRDLQSRLTDDDTQNVLPMPSMPKQQSRRFFLAVAASFLIGFALLFFYQRTMIEPTVLEARDGNLETTLPDGSTVTLRKGSRLAWLGDLSQGTRQLTLSGQALFDVKHTKQPFIVSTDLADVRVLGTVFSVRHYDVRTEVFVVEGKVELSNEISGTMILDVSERAYIQRPDENNRFVLMETEYGKVEEDRHQYELAWLNGGFRFNTTKLRDVVAELSQVYGQTIILEQEELGSEPVSGTFNEMELQKILEEISLTLQLKYQARPQGGYILSAK